LYNNSANTQFTGKSIHFLPSCHSTNTEASLLIRAQKAVNGLIVITNEQTAGRGQQGNSWLSKADSNLTFSVIFFPEKLHLKDSFYLNIVSSLSIAKTVDELVPENIVKVKWPNDILLNNKKVCGILIENMLRGEHIHAVVMGIGVNVNHSDGNLPFAGAMSSEAAKTFHLQEVFTRICENLEPYYLMLEQGLFAELDALYLQNLYGLNEKKHFSDSEGNFTGTIQAVLPGGLLQVEKESGVIKQYTFKEVSLVK
jgi:BirA family biotin operon repressor/biotin-[acetyl-CoA-carboxylase] ligase